MKRFHRLVLLLVLSLVYAGCERKDGTDSGSPATRVFEVRGVVQDIRQDGRVLIVDHEEIPGYMRKMIMPFQVAENHEDDTLRPGDEIEFSYHVEEVRSWIEEIRRTGVTKPVTVADVEALPGPEDVPVLGIGDTMPDYEFVDQDGRAVKLSDYRGVPVALTFVFSRCPVPEYCPAMMRNFDEIENSLKEDPESPENWKLLTISFDTWNDTPETMKAYGTAFGRDSEQWSLLSTEDCCTINKIGGNVGLKFTEKNGSLVHNLRTVVLDPEGRIARIFTDETWAPDQVVAEIRRLGNS